MKKYSVIKDKGMSPDWYVEYVQVFVKGSEYFFPCYEWVEDGYTVPEGKAFIPQRDSSDVLTAFRSTFLSAQRKTYRWRAEPEPGDLTYEMNGHLQAEQHKDLPRNTQWTAERDNEFHNMRATGIKNLLLNRFVGAFRKFDSLDQVKKENGKQFLVAMFQIIKLVYQKCRLGLRRLNLKFLI